MPSFYEQARPIIVAAFFAFAANAFIQIAPLVVSEIRWGGLVMPTKGGGGTGCDGCLIFWVAVIVLILAAMTGGR